MFFCITSLLLRYAYWCIYKLFLVFQLVSNFQTEAQNRTLEAEETKKKLMSLRRMIARLLKSINDVSEQCCTA